jgi:hypothetical protein
MNNKDLLKSLMECRNTKTSVDIPARGDYQHCRKCRGEFFHSYKARLIYPTEEVMETYKCENCSQEKTTRTPIKYMLDDYEPISGDKEELPNMLVSK